VDQRSKHKNSNYKTLRRKYRKKLHDIEFSHDFLDMTPKVQAIKEKLDQLDFIKIKTKKLGLGCNLVVELLPSICKALHSIFISYTTKNSIIKNFCTSKCTIYRAERQSSEVGNIFKSYI
jgi:hypothetical protein